MAENDSSKEKRILQDMMPEYHDVFVEDTLLPRKIKAGVDEYRQLGRMQGLSNLFDLFMDSDDNLQSCIDIRQSVLKQAVWSWEGELTEEQQEFYQRLLNAKLAGWVEEFMEGKLKGYCFHQILWEVEDGRYVPTIKSYRNLDLRRVKGELKLYEVKGAREQEVELPELKFLVKLYKRPVLQTILRYYVFYGMAINNWAQFTETYGKPPRIGRYEPNATLNEIDVLRQAVKSLGTDQAAVISKNTDIEFKDFAGKQTSSDLYEKLCQFVSTRVTKRILGQTLTTQEGDTGSYAQAKVHNMVREDIQEADLSDFRMYLDAIIRRVHELNWGGTAPQIQLEIRQFVSRADRIVIDRQLWDMGLPMTQDHFYETYDVPKPEKGQDVMPAPSRGFPFSAQANSVQRQILSTQQKDNSLVKLQKEIRGLKTIEDLRAYNPRGFIAEWGGELGDIAFSMYIKTRKDNNATQNQTNHLATHAQPRPNTRFEWDTTSIAKVQGFRNQGMIVSGVRTKAALAQLVELAEEAIQQGGSFQDFIGAASLAGFEPENPFHWQTEMDTARVAAASAGAWDEFQAEKDIFPYLQYMTMADELVREEHAVLHGVVAPVDDPFWQENYPPNGWNCRCYVEQLTEGEAQREPGFGKEKPYFIPPAGFRGNSGINGKIPGGADELYGQYAEKQGEDLNHIKPKARSFWARLFNLGNEKIVLDAAGYPVDLNGFSEAQDDIQKATEIWHQLGVITYIHMTDKKVRIVSASEGKVTAVRELARIEYKGEGREGFRER